MRAVVVGLRCRSWRCVCCAVRLRRRARARAFLGSAGQRVMLLTLTVDPRDPRFDDPANRAGKRRPRASALLDEPRAGTIEESTRYVAWAWNRLRTNLTNRLGPVAYFRGLELQASGMAHLHVIVRVKDPAEFLRVRSVVRGPEHDRASGLAVMAGFGLVVDAQLARSGGDVARYVTKAEGGSDVAAYATKGMSTAFPRYTRRSAWSIGRASAWAPGWVRPTPIAGFRWRIAKAAEETIRAALAGSDWHLVDPAMLRISSAPMSAGGT